LPEFWEFRYQLLAALSGTATKCLLAFWWERRQLTVSELEPRVGHDKNTVRKALAQLALYGLAGQVISSQETWCLTNKGYQLPLPLDALSGEKNSPLTTTTTLDPSGLNLSSSSSTPGGENFTTDESEAYEAALEALFAHNIRGRKAEKLAALEWVTPEYVHAHVAQVKREHQKLGLAIVRMEAGEEPAPDPDDAATARRYIEDPRVQR
jgi:hypothetical protein